VVGARPRNRAVHYRVDPMCHTKYHSYSSV
jgi:hypothetical protein